MAATSPATAEDLEWAARIVPIVYGEGHGLQARLLALASITRNDDRLLASVLRRYLAAPHSWSWGAGETEAVWLLRNVIQVTDEEAAAIRRVAPVPQP